MCFKTRRVRIRNFTVVTGVRTYDVYLILSEDLVKTQVNENQSSLSELIPTHCGVCQSDDGKGTEDRDGAFMSY